MFFKVKKGVHEEGGKRYVKGDVVKSDSNLVKLFTNKFEQVQSNIIIDQPQVAKAPVKEEPSSKGAEVKSEGTADSSAPLLSKGKDVTDKFEDAGVSIFRNGVGKNKVYTIMDNDIVLVDELKTKAAVENWLTAFASE